VELIAIAEVGPHIGRPLVGLGQQNTAGELAVDLAPHLLEVSVGLRQVLAVGTLALEQVGDGVGPKAIDTNI
jgi:hypothetical protein